MCTVTFSENSDNTHSIIVNGKRAGTIKCLGYTKSDSYQGNTSPWRVFWNTANGHVQGTPVDGRRNILDSIGLDKLKEILVKYINNNINELVPDERMQPKYYCTMESTSGVTLVLQCSKDTMAYGILPAFDDYSVSTGFHSSFTLSIIKKVLEDPKISYQSFGELMPDTVQIIPVHMFYDISWYSTLHNKNNVL